MRSLETKRRSLLSEIESLESKRDEIKKSVEKAEKTINFITVESRNLEYQEIKLDGSRKKNEKILEALEKIKEELNPKNLSKDIKELIERRTSLQKEVLRLEDECSDLKYIIDLKREKSLLESALSKNLVICIF